MKVIVAIDQTVNWKQVIEGVIKRRWQGDTEFRILTVVPPVEWQDIEALESSEILREILKMRRESAEHILAQAREMISSNVEHCSVHTDLREGSARSEILDSAIDWMADEIILGAHGHAPNRLFPATVSRSVAQHALCSVAFVRLKPGSVSEGRPAKKEKGKVGAPK